MIPQKDKVKLRELAKHQMALAESEKNQAIIKEWYRHHRFEEGRPMVHIELWTFEQDIIPKRLKCESQLGRDIESQLYRNFINHEIIGDDRTVPDYYPVHWKTYFNLFDLKVETTHSNNDDGINLGHQFEHQLRNLKEDIPELKPSTFGVDRSGTLSYRDMVEDVIGDILPVRMEMNALSSCPTQDLVHLMGMETMFLGMYDVPELFKSMMDQVAEDYIRYFRWLEKEKLLLSTNGHQLLGNGSFCFTDELPGGGGPVMSNQVWGFMDSQETVGVSPEMFGEFILPAYKKIAKEFGVLSYGCCEPVDPLWENQLSTVENLRKISISPWCNEQAMGDYLRNSKVIYFRKPSPNYLGVNKQLDEEAFRRHIRDTVEAAKGCQLEFAQRDVYTIKGNEEKVRRAVDIIREESY